MNGLRRRLSLAPCCLAAAIACARPAPAPDAAYRALVEAVRARDAERAWPLLSPATQAWLDARAKAAAAQAPGVVVASGKALLLGSAAAATRPPKSIVLVRESADRAVLQVTDDGAEAPREIVLVKDGRWRVDLPEPK
jgi:hypothetical protein